MNLSFYNKLENKVRIGIYTSGLTGAGLQRSTSLIINHFYKIKIFDIYLFTVNIKEDNEYLIPKNVKRIIIKYYIIENLIKEVKKKMIDILIYQFPSYEQIVKLNKLKNIKIIFYIHQCFLYWIYYNYFTFKNLYKIYQSLKYVISLIPFENDYLFTKWGIRSILMDNFISYEYNSIIQSDLSTKIILMIGRANDKLKRFELGIKSMKYLIKDIPNCVMKIISEIIDIDFLKVLIKKLNLENYIRFIGYTPIPELYYKNSSLHIFPSISECFPMILCETKIYGIPNILIGIDYVKMLEGGTIVIYDDSPRILAKEAINILKKDKYRKKLGMEARRSMKIFKNELLLKKWVKLLLSIYNGDEFYQKFREINRKISKNKAINIIKKQINFLKLRIKKFRKINIYNLENFSFMENLN